MYIAHRRKFDGKEQSVEEHLSNVSILAARFASKIGLGECGKLLGLLHDLGKFSTQFQNYIRSAEGLINPDEDDYVDANVLKGKIDHSTAGAQLIQEIVSSNSIEDLVTKQVLSLIVVSHHSSLLDCIDPSGEDVYSKRILKDFSKTNFLEVKEKLNQSNLKLELDSIDLKSITKDIFDLVSSKIPESDKNSKPVKLKRGLLIRFLFSCLIDADRIDSADFSRLNIRSYSNYISWELLCSALEKELSLFKGNDNVSIQRKYVADTCLSCSQEEKNIFSLTVPTGGGKTLSSLRFALNHAKKHSLDRIIYIIPYTSIIDQNAQTVRKIYEKSYLELVDSIVLEHHCNIISDEVQERDKIWNQKILSEDWDAPIVFTTMVQFLNTLYSSSTQSARRMHALANSVLIFDEIQSLPIECIHLFNNAIMFLKDICNSSIVLCTATQLPLDSVRKNLGALVKSKEIIDDIPKLFKSLERTNVHDIRKQCAWSLENIKDFILNKFKEIDQILIIVNTKKSCIELFQEIQECEEVHDDCLFHLSTNMCPAHRLETLDTVKKRLENKLPTICITTQLIEAGVDIDFKCVIRFLAGCDSIAQAAGRCNRNGKINKGDVYIINYNNEQIQSLKAIYVGAKKAQTVLDLFKRNPLSFDNSLLSTKTMESYFAYYFKAREEEMDYPINEPKGETILSLLSCNKNSVEIYKHRCKADCLLPFKQAFKTANSSFKAISTEHKNILVPYQEGKSLISSLKQAKQEIEIFRLLRKVQRYQVGIFSNTFDRLLEEGIIEKISDTLDVYYVSKENYNKRIGFTEENNEEFN